MHTRTVHTTASAAAVALVASLALPSTAAAAPPALDIPVRRFDLDNGLVVLLHEDHTLPQVTVNLSYQVGSKDEAPGRTGFAHLFEHLMFMGTAAGPPRGLRRGGWRPRAPGTTPGRARTAPTTSRSGRATRCRCSCGSRRTAWRPSVRAIDQVKLDLQRDVVRNERRQTSENTPYGLVELELPKLLYPPGHPYHHPVIGSHEDLQAASVADVRSFFARFYVPNNASLVIAGDFDPVAAEAMVRQHFAGIPRAADPHAGRAPVAPPAPAHVRDIVKVTDRVDQPRVHFAYQTPAHFQADDAALSLLGTVLSTGKGSRLHAALVYADEVAQDVAAAQWSGVLGSRFVIQATAREGVSAEALQAKMDAVLSKLLKDGVTADETERARNGVQMAFVSGLQGLGDRAGLLNQYMAEVGRPDFVAADLARYTALTPDDVSRAARTWLAPERRGVLWVLPAPEAPEPPATPAAPAAQEKP
jgi:zinc protease